MLMAMVTTIGVLVIASRVAGSRQSAASASLSLAARQAAEFGYAEVMAEMNRDPKSYLWVTKFSEWNNITTQDLKSCGVASSADPTVDPISGLKGEGVLLPNSTLLSYKITAYSEPSNVGSSSNNCTAKFGNLLGGTAQITILGTAKASQSGNASTHSLIRTISIKRVSPIFNNPINSAPTTTSFDFPPYPGTPSGSYVDITCEPSSSTVIKCTSPTSTENFKNATSTSSGIDYFPYRASGALWDPCQQVGANVRCLVKSMTVKKGANMRVATKRDTTDVPVEIYLSESMTIEEDGKLSGENWTGFRIFGVPSGLTCPSQTMNINSYTNISPAAVQVNLQNAFVWLGKGQLKYNSTKTLTSIPSLVGFVCVEPTIGVTKMSALSYLSDLSNRAFMEGLGGAYGFNGVFGGSNPIRFFYRGFGFSEQSSSS